MNVRKKLIFLFTRTKLQNTAFNTQINNNIHYYPQNMYSKLQNLRYIKFICQSAYQMLDFMAEYFTSSRVLRYYPVEKSTFARLFESGPGGNDFLFAAGSLACSLKIIKSELKVAHPLEAVSKERVGGNEIAHRACVFW